MALRGWSHDLISVILSFLGVQGMERTGEDGQADVAGAEKNIHGDCCPLRHPSPILISPLILLYLLVLSLLFL